MKSALEKKAPAVEANGNNVQTLSLPIPLQDEVIGVIGFNRSKTNPGQPRKSPRLKPSPNSWDWRWKTNACLNKLKKPWQKPNCSTRPLPS